MAFSLLAISVWKQEKQTLAMQELAAINMLRLMA
jgi:hypothetical protein